MLKIKRQMIAVIISSDANTVEERNAEFQHWLDYRTDFAVELDKGWRIICRPRPIIGYALYVGISPNGEEIIFGTKDMRAVVLSRNYTYSSIPGVKSWSYEVISAPGVLPLDDIFAKITGYPSVQIYKKLI